MKRLTDCQSGVSSPTFTSSFFFFTWISDQNYDDGYYSEKYDGDDKNLYVDMIRLKMFMIMKNLYYQIEIDDNYDDDDKNPPPRPTAFVSVPI